MATRPTTETKRELRAALGKLQPDANAEQLRALDSRIHGRVLELTEIRDAQSVLVCLSFGAEPETRPLIHALLGHDKVVYLPRADRSDRKLHLHRWPCELRRLQIGVEQPLATVPELAAERIDATIDATVILGLAFDESGIRLGHGSGYVDRFLAAHPVPAVGLTREDRLVATLPRATHDVPMDVLVTEDRVVRPGSTPHQALREWLGLDHREIDALLRRSLPEGGFEAEPFARFRERLLRHIGIEEKLLFPATRRRSPDREAVRLSRLRVEHGGLTSLLVPTPDRALACEIRALLVQHNEIEEGLDGVYQRCINVLTAEDARALLQSARARAPVPTTGYFDGPGTVRTAAEALAKAERSRRS